MAEDCTQAATQQAVDPRRLGRSISGLDGDDAADVLCILHPGSPAAYRSVKQTARFCPQHILQNQSHPYGRNADPESLQDTLVNAEDIALRFSSAQRNLKHGFCFGRNITQCDVILAEDPSRQARRISNAHFLIKPNENGVLMLTDISTNGTIVDNDTLFGRRPGFSNTLALTNGTTIQIASQNPEHKIIFHVKIPSREGFEDEFAKRFEKYMRRLASVEAPDDPLAYSNSRQTLIIPKNNFGMKWDGRPNYSVTSFLGRGAFASVYQLTTRSHGQLFAVKELEKRRFVKDGVLDRKITNEMDIMQSVKHKHIVEYINYHDIDDYLYIVMEYVGHGDLQQYLRNGPCSEEIGAAVARQTLEALHYLHSKNITHRDIKPDNILISSIDPFIIKLSDFGLSKVKKEESFLKTFCGTLLYCAPEVFPHYQAAKGGQKRRHNLKIDFYTHAVDIWSLGGVLFNAIAGKPPFEGVVDHTGKGMFERIMYTPLDLTPLEAQGISRNAQDILKQMLSTQPELRPTAHECLVHAWLFDGTVPSSPIYDYLDDIEEENEEAQKFSQLSLREGQTASDFSRSDLDQVDENGSFDFQINEIDFATTRSKRVKTDQRYPRNQARHNSDFESSEEDAGSAPLPMNSRQELRLFGEIGPSALQDSHVLSHETKAALERDPRNKVLVPGTQLEQSDIDYIKGHTNVDEASVIISPEESDSFSTSQISSTNSYVLLEMLSNEASSVSEETPRAAQRSQFEENECTPTNRNKNPANSANGSNSSTSHTLSLQSRTPKPMPVELAMEWQNNPPKYGALISTVDSAQSFFLPLNARYFTYGRNPECTVAYPFREDRRVSKNSFLIIFNGTGIDSVVGEGQDWTKINDLHVLIKNLSKTTKIWVNDVELPRQNENDQKGCTTRLYTDDIITLFQPSLNRGEEYLRFYCSFFVGGAKDKRRGPVILEPTWNTTSATNKDPQDNTITLVRR